MRFASNILAVILALLFVPGKCMMMWEQFKGERATAALHAKLEPVLDLCRKASRVEVYEGLPDRESEREVVGQDAQRAHAMMNHEFGLYTPAMPLRPNDAQSVGDHLCKLSSYHALVPRAKGGLRSVSGPDLLVRFHTEEGLVDVQLFSGFNRATFYAGDLTLYAGSDSAFWRFWVANRLGYR